MLLMMMMMTLTTKSWKKFPSMDLNKSKKEIFVKKESWET
jgi:hypothetical protein